MAYDSVTRKYPRTLFRETRKYLSTLFRETRKYPADLFRETRKYLRTLVLRRLPTPRPWLFLCLAYLPAASASPFLVSDPWPLVDGAGKPVPQPTHCAYQEGTRDSAGAWVASAPVVEAPVAANPNGTVFCHIDLAGVNRAGAHPTEVWARNALATSTHVSFDIGAIAAPTNLHILP